MQIYDFQRDSLLPSLTTAPLEGGRFAWAPDGQHVVLVRTARDGKDYAFLWARADGAGEPHVLFESKTDLLTAVVAPDGKSLIFGRRAAQDFVQWWTLPLDQTDPHRPKAGEPKLLLDAAQFLGTPEFSPDGRWLAYRTLLRPGGQDPGTIEVRPYPDVSASKVQIGTGNGVRWRGKQLFFVGRDLRVMVVDYTLNGTQFVPSKPRVWSETRLASTAFDIGSDGRILGFETPAATQQGNLHATFLLNFFDEVRRRIP